MSAEGWLSVSLHQVRAPGDAAAACNDAVETCLPTRKDVHWSCHMKPAWSTPAQTHVYRLSRQGQACQDTSGGEATAASVLALLSCLWYPTPHKATLAPPSQAQVETEEPHGFMVLTESESSARGQAAALGDL